MNYPDSAGRSDFQRGKSNTRDRTAALALFLLILVASMNLGSQPVLAQVVFGPGAIASGIDTTALGNNALANQTNATAVGHQAQATGTNATALGKSAIATGLNTTAVGQGAFTNQQAATALGAAAAASGIGSTALGAGGLQQGPHLEVWRPSPNMYPLRVAGAVNGPHSDHCVVHGCSLGERYQPLCHSRHAWIDGGERQH